jgi:hypothetical protein
MKIGNRQRAAGSIKKAKCLLSALSAVLFAPCTAALAQQPKKVPRIGFLASGDPNTARSESIRQALGELGYVEGQNIAIEYRYSEGTAIGLLSLPLN